GLPTGRGDRLDIPFAGRLLDVSLDGRPGFDRERGDGRSLPLLSGIACTILGRWTVSADRSNFGVALDFSGGRDLGKGLGLTFFLSHSLTLSLFRLSRSLPPTEL